METLLDNDEQMMGKWWEHDGLLRLRCKMMETMVISWIRIFDGIWFTVIFDGAIWWDITNQHFPLVYICYIWVWLNMRELALIIGNHEIWRTLFSDKPGWFVAFWAWWWWYDDDEDDDGDEEEEEEEEDGYDDQYD